jgi:hypothetical protein
MGYKTALTATNWGFRDILFGEVKVSILRNYQFNDVNDMAWIVDKKRSQEELAVAFQKKMEETAILRISGAHDGISTLIAKNIGFES